MFYYFKFVYVSIYMKNETHNVFVYRAPIHENNVDHSLRQRLRLLHFGVRNERAFITPVLSATSRCSALFQVASLSLSVDLSLSLSVALSADSHFCWLLIFFALCGDLRRSIAFYIGEIETQQDLSRLHWSRLWFPRLSAPHSIAIWRNWYSNEFPRW